MNNYRRYLVLFLSLLGFTAPIMGQTLLIITDGPLVNYEDLLTVVRNELRETDFSSAFSRALYIESMVEEEPSRAQELIEEALRANFVDLIVCLGPASSAAAVALDPSVPLVVFSYLIGTQDELYWADVAKRTGRQFSRDVVLLDLNLLEERRRYSGDLMTTIPQPAVDFKLARWMTPANLDGMIVLGDEGYLESLPGNDVLQLLPLWHMPEVEQKKILTNMEHSGIAVLSSGGETSGNYLATYKPTLWKRLGRELSLHIGNLLNISMGRISPDRAMDSLAKVHFEPQLSLNHGVMKNLKIQVPWETILMADSLDDSRFSGSLTLQTAVADALENSSTLRISKLDRDLQAYAVKEARSLFKPSVDAYLSHVTIDEDRAESAISPYEQEASFGFRAGQVIWSDEAWTNYRIQRYLRDSSDQLLKSQTQDTIRDASVAYFELMRSLSAVRIQKETLDRTREYLEQAEQLVDLGQETPLTVYRFRNQMARDKQSLLDSLQQAKAAMTNMQYQRGMISPTGELSLENLPGGNGISALTERVIPILESVRTPSQTMVFEEKVLEIADRNSSLVASYDSRINALQSERKMRARSFFSPTFSLSSEWKYTFYQGGSGAGTEISLAPGFTFDTSSMDNSDNIDWSASFVMSLPLYSGRQRVIALKKTELKLEQSREIRRAVSESLNVQAQIQTVSLLATYEKWQESLSAKDASQQGMEFVMEAYDKGQATSLDLLDAQSDASIASIAALNREHEFHLSIVGMLRILDEMDALVSEKESDEFLRNLEGILQDREEESIE